MRGFKVGDDVVNSYGARGRVVSITNGAVHVVFTSSGKTWNGAFDGEWFQKFPGMLSKAPARASGGER